MPHDGVVPRATSRVRSIRFIEVVRLCTYVPTRLGSIVSYDRFQLGWIDAVRQFPHTRCTRCGDIHQRVVPCTKGFDILHMDRTCVDTSDDRKILFWFHRFFWSWWDIFATRLFLFHRQSCYSEVIQKISRQSSDIGILHREWIVLICVRCIVFPNSEVRCCQIIQVVPM